MTRLDDWLKLIDDPTTVLAGHDPVDDALAAFLVQLAFADGVVQDDELAFFSRVWPDRSRDEVARAVESRAVRPVDLEALAPLGASIGGRRRLLDLAARVVGLDGAVATEEVVHLHRIVDHLGLSHDAIREALAEVVGTGGPVAPEHVRATVASMRWPRLRALAVAGEADALAVLARSEDGQPDIVVRETELWARFVHGAATVRFEAIVGYTRLPVRGRAFHVRTDEGDHALVDPAFRDLGLFLDRLYEL